ncbi:MAG: hypothetical protein ACTS3F_07775 [Phycisphaerales bacterium]
MRITTTGIGAILLVSAAGAAPAIASYTITQGTSAPSYATTLNFDEPGGPTGLVATDAWASLGLAEMQAGDSAPFVGDFSAATPWVNDGNAFYGNFGVFMTFSTDLTALSLQVWDPSGPPSFFGGGLNVILFNDGAEVWDLFVQTGDIATPAWGGLGDEWFDITATDGMVFDEVRILGFSFSPTTYADNISWTAVPAPANAALFVLAGLGAARRRRA